MSQPFPTFAEYCRLTEETANYPHVGLNIVYPSIGLVDELGEVYDKLLEGSGGVTVLKEVGDVAWYCARLCGESNIDPEGLEKQIIVPPGHNSREVQIATVSVCLRASCRLLGKVKKLMRDMDYEPGQVPLHMINDDFASFVREVLIVVLAHLASLTTSHQSTFYRVLQMNVDKLRDRKARGMISGNGDDR